MNNKQVEQADFSPLENAILDSIIEDEIEFQLWMQSKRAKSELKRALNSCGMTKGGTFAKGNSCAGTKGTGKSKTKKPKRQPKKYTREGWKKSLNDWMDRNNLDKSKFWNKSKGRVELPDMETIKKIAEEQSKGKPDEATKESYDKFKKHLMSQYDALVESGLIVKAWKGDGEPYKVSEEKMWVPSSKKMREKVEETGVFYFFMTDKGFGEGQNDKAHPFLQMSSAKTADGEPMLYNDVFRVVHDAVAHLNGGYSFSTRGEMNAMLAHASTLPKDTWAALWAETFAQNAYYEVNKKFAPQNYYTSKYVNMIEELQEQANKQAEVSRADMPIENEEEGCGCNRRRRAIGAKFRYYAKRFLANKSRPDIKRFTSNPAAKKKKKGKTGGCGNNGQGFVQGNTCATGSPAGPTTGMKEVKGKQPFQEDIHPETEMVMDAKWAKGFAGKQSNVKNPSELTKIIAKEIRKKEKDHDVFLVPIDKQGKLTGKIVNVDSRLLLGDGTSQDAMGLLNGEYRLEFVKVENSPLRDMKNRDSKTPVRKDNPKRGKRFKAAAASMTASQTAQLANQVLKDQKLTKEEVKDLNNFIQYKSDQEKLAEEAKKKKGKAKYDFDEDEYFSWNTKSVDDFKTEDDYFAWKKKAKKEFEKKKKKTKAKPKQKPLDDFDKAISEQLGEWKNENALTPKQEAEQSGRPSKLNQNLKDAETKIRKAKFEVAHSFDAEGNPLFVATSNSTEYIEFSPDQIAQLKDGVSTHNHPKGGSFSPADIEFAIGADLKEIRAVSPKTGYTFVLQRPKSGWNKKMWNRFTKSRKKVTTELQNQINPANPNQKKTMTREVGMRFVSELVVQDWIMSMIDDGVPKDERPIYHELIDVKN